MPYTVAAVFELEIECNLFRKILLVVAPLTVIPVTLALVEESELTALLLKFMIDEALEQVIPKTVPPVPVDDKPVTVLPEIVTVLVPEKVAPRVIPVIEPEPVMFEIVLFDKLFVVPPPQ